MAKKTLEKMTESQEAVALVRSRYNVAKAYVQPYQQKFQRFYQLYRGYLDKSRLPWRSNLFIPKVFEIVETVAPRIAQAQKNFKALAVEGTDEGNAEAYSDLLKFQFQHANMEDNIEEWSKGTLIYGTGINKVFWKDGQPGAEVVDPFDFYPDPKARYDWEMKYAIHRVERDIEDLEQNSTYDQTVVARLKKEGGSKSSDDVQRLQRLGLQGVNAQDGTRQRFEVLEYHGYFKGKIYIIAITGEDLLRLDESPYPWIPFVVIQDHHVPHELYGIGEVEPVESLQNELNDLRNQRMDNIKINLNTMFKVVAGGVQFEDELVSRPGGIIHLTRPDGLLPNDRAPIDSSAFPEESVIKSDMERTTGANSSIGGALVSPMGGNQGGVINRTATAYQGSINQADKRFTAKINNLKRGLIRVGRMFLEMDQLFMTAPQVVRVVGEDVGQYLTKILPEDIKGGFDLEVEIDYLDDFQQAQQDIQLLQTLGQVPGFNVPQLASDILEKMGKKDVKKYLQPPQPTPPPPEQPRIQYQMRGDLAPDAVAQLLDKTEGIKTNPDVVASQMRAAQMQEHQAQAKVLATVGAHQPSAAEQHLMDLQKIQAQQTPDEGTAEQATETGQPELSNETQEAQ